MSRGGVLVAALLVTLATPATWPLALAAFLVRGGIVLIALPIVVLPTPVGLGTAIAPTLSSVAFGTIPPEFVIVSGAIVVGVFGWLVAGGWLAAALEAEAVRMVAGDEEVAGTGLVGMRADAEPETIRLPPATVAARILVARLIAYLPLGVILVLGSVRVVFVTYRELTVPVDVSTPIVLRVLLAAPEVVVAVVAAWTLAEIVGAVAARRIVLADAGVGSALRWAARSTLRHPGSTLARFWLPMVVLFAVLVAGARAAASAWEAVGAILGQASDPFRVLVTVVAFVALWIVGLLLISVACAWRAAVWTVAEVTREVTREGTFGGSTDRRPGH